MVEHSVCIRETRVRFPLSPKKLEAWQKGGGLAERFKALVLKTSWGKLLTGSNPVPSESKCYNKSNAKIPHCPNN